MARGRRLNKIENEFGYRYDMGQPPPFETTREEKIKLTKETL
jgi:hypothetical protein